MEKILRTQNGNLIEIKENDRPFIGCIRINHHHSEIFCTLVDENNKPLKYYGTIGTYFEEAVAERIEQKVKDFLNGKEQFYFSIPIDLSKDWISITEKICENNRLVMATVEEASLYFKDKAEARRLAEETDYFERRNVIIYDENGFFKSFNKWKKLNRAG